MDHDDGSAALKKVNLEYKMLHQAEDTSNISQADFFVHDDYLGAGYTDILNAFHQHLKPRNYFEIGTQSGATLALAECASLAVDPMFVLDRNVVGKKPCCMMYQMSSDDFFTASDPKALLGGPIDLAFLDGMHWFEFLLRDFINVEKHARFNSIILLHDCIPTDTHIARRNIHDDKLAALSPHPSWWAGDVWKTIAILMEYRPDLKIYGCQVQPTGLIAITGLDPHNTILSKNYFSMIEKYRDMPASKDIFELYIRNLRLLDQTEFLDHERMANRFWI